MTSIEWLYQLSKQRELDKFDLEQAKEMHKQEIIDAHIHGHNAPSSTLKNFDAEQYYQETFVSKGSSNYDIADDALNM